MDEFNPDGVCEFCFGDGIGGGCPECGRTIIGCKTCNDEGIYAPDGCPECRALPDEHDLYDDE